MVDTVVLEATGESRGSSSLPWGTNNLTLLGSSIG